MICQDAGAPPPPAFFCINFNENKSFCWKMIFIKRLAYSLVEKYQIRSLIQSFKLHYDHTEKKAGTVKLGGWGAFFPHYDSLCRYIHTFFTSSSLLNATNTEQ